MQNSSPSEAASEECARCLKPIALCVCDGIVPIDTKTSLLILQHPQEQDRSLGTARLAALHFKRATFKIGLSWSSLAAALGRQAEPRRWAVLHLGSAKAASLAPGRDIVVLDRKGKPVPDQDRALEGIDGIVLLDGTWSQAKALWWRNPWVLKAKRIVLAPRQPSRYGALRREPRRDSLSTLEAAAMLLGKLDRNPAIEAALLTSFDRLLERYRAVSKTSETAGPISPARPRPRRRRR